MKPQTKIIVVIVAVTVGIMLIGGGRQESPETLQTVLSTVDGVGDVYIYYEKRQQQTLFLSQTTATGGVLIVCEGCHSQAIQLLIVDAVSAVLNIPTHQIKVLPLQEEER